MTDKLNALKAVTFPPAIMEKIVHEHHKNNDGILEIIYDFWNDTWRICLYGYVREVATKGENLESVFQGYCREMRLVNERFLAKFKE